MPTPNSDRPEVLYCPPRERQAASELQSFMNHVNDRHHVVLDNYYDLQQWSVDDVGRFWRELVRFFRIPCAGELEPALVGEMPDAHWFPNLRLNYTECVFFNMTPERAKQTALVVSDETLRINELRWGDLAGAVVCVREHLMALGVERGDRVCGYLTNTPEAVIAFLATASLGAIWSSCPPEFGAASVLERFSQIEPKVLFAVDGYQYAGKQFPRSQEVRELVAGLPSLNALVWVAEDFPPNPASRPSSLEESRIRFFSSHLQLSTAEAMNTVSSAFMEKLEFQPTMVEFEAPLWILYSSGTTGKPKAIVHGHGGIVLEHIKVLALQSDLGPQDRFFWFSTTGWMMWNYLVGGLLVGTQVVLYDGSPTFPDERRLWQLAQKVNVSYFGASAPFYMHCRAAGLAPGGEFQLPALRALGSTGAPLPSEGYRWVYQSVGADLHLQSVCGGTDVCTAFLCGSPLSDVRAGELSCRALGADVRALNAQGESVLDEVGELSLCQPMPSMPVEFWGDRDGTRRRASYFSRFDGVWCHGDWIRCYEEGASVIYGRSDATLNRGGVRMGTSEFYRVIEGQLGVVDSLVVDTSELGLRGTLWLFVVLGVGVKPASVAGALKRLIRQRISPRHVPDEIRFVSQVPYTLSGKKLEVPIKRLIQRWTKGELPSSPVLFTEEGHGIQLGTLKHPEAIAELLEVLVELPSPLDPSAVN